MTTAHEPQVDRLLSVPLRRPATVATGLAAFVLVGLAARYWDGSAPGRIDRSASGLVDTVSPEFATVTLRLIRLGQPERVISVAVILAMIALGLGRARLALLAVVGPGLTGVTTTLLKPVVGRDLNGNLAYPSGHTGAATSIGIILALLVMSFLPLGRAGSCAVLAGGALLAGGSMAVALIAAGDHYPTDTVGGFCTAVGVVLGAALVLDRIALHVVSSAEKTER